MEWKCLHFNDLSLVELYGLMKLRQEVFVVEQDCPYVDADGKDPDGWHLFASVGPNIVACTRILPKEISYDDAVSIGRVVTGASVRGKQIGKLLMQKSIEKTKELFPDQPVRISAQSYLKQFYESFGFKQYSEEYLEDGIPHIGMVLSNV